MGKVKVLVFQCVKIYFKWCVLPYSGTCLIVGATNRSIRTLTVRRNTSLVQPCVTEVYLMLRDV